VDIVRIFFNRSPPSPWQKLQSWQRQRAKRATNAHSGPGNLVARPFQMPAGKRIVYILKNTDSPPRYYTGLTSNVAARLMFHNNGLSPHTAGGRPWKMDVVIEFADEHRAVAFEKYLKSGSGVAFSMRHLRSST
jgi:putative endonuclease